MVSKREAIPVTPHILVSYWIAAGIEKMCVCVFGQNKYVLKQLRHKKWGSFDEMSIMCS